MTRLFNIDIDSIITDYKISYQNENDNFINQVNRLNNNVLKEYTHRAKEHNQILSMYLILSTYAMFLKKIIYFIIF